MTSNLQLALPTSGLDDKVIAIKTPKKTTENPHEFFPTDPRLAYAICCALRDLELLNGDEEERVLDVGAGTGVFGEQMRRVFPKVHITGVEIRNEPHPPAYDTWSIYDYVRGEERFTEYDCVMGNLPFKLQEKILPRVFNSLHSFGIAAFFMRQGWIGGGAKRQRGLLSASQYPHWMQLNIPERPVFYKTSDPRTDYVLAIWIKGRQPTLKHPRRVATLWWKDGYELTP